MNKYTLTNNTIVHKGKTLYQIKALRSFGNVKEGDLGGYIEKEENLSQEGLCWVHGKAQVYENALVCGEAHVSGNACVSGNALVYGDCTEEPFLPKEKTYFPLLIKIKGIYKKVSSLEELPINEEFSVVQTNFKG